MIILKGFNAAKGIAFGRLVLFEKNEEQIPKYRISNVKEELNRYENAKEVAIEGLEMLYNKSLKSLSESDAMIFEVHKLMIQDEEFDKSVVNFIKEEKVNAEYAVKKTSNKLKKIFISLDSQYIKNRIADIEDITERLINVLSGTTKRILHDNEPFIVIAENLFPSEIIQIDKHNLKGIATMRGSVNSHSVILAGAINIPAVVGIGKKLKAEYNGKKAIIDGYTGNLYINPTESIINKLKQRQKADEVARSNLLKLKDKDSVTISGKKINICANVRNLKEVNEAIDNNVEGIGLFRSEFLYFGRSTPPNEEEQFEIYKDVAKKMGKKKVVIRTLDMGVDKNVNYLNVPKEENPAMGYRAIRLCFDYIDLFKVQLRAIYRAALFGNVNIMFPMIASLWEVERIKEIINEVKSELKKEGVAYSDDVKFGIMIETPAAALISDILAKHVDFFSIGTNDLSQYVLAIDRQNEQLGYFYNPHHEATLRLIEMTAKNANDAGIGVSICGELAADVSLTKRFVSCGINEFSVSPSFVLKLKDEILKLNI